MKNYLALFVMAAMLPLFYSCDEQDNPVTPETPVVPETPSDNKDERINEVIPEEIRSKMEENMPIYDGVNPPNVEGIYLMSPAVIAYDSYKGVVVDGNLPDGIYIKFANQDAEKKTIDCLLKEGDHHDSEGDGVFISGEGNNFTIYFNTSGTDADIKIKTATVVSGTKTENGIKDLCMGAVMIEKGDDPNNLLMEVGRYRVVKDKDGLCEIAEWPASTRKMENRYSQATKSSFWLFRTIK